MYVDAPGGVLQYVASFQDRLQAVRDLAWSNLQAAKVQYDNEEGSEAHLQGRRLGSGLVDSRRREVGDEVRIRLSRKWVTATMLWRHPI